MTENTAEPGLEPDPPLLDSEIEDNEDEVGDDETGEVVEIDTVLPEPGEDDEDPEEDDEDDDEGPGLAHDDDPFGTGF